MSVASVLFAAVDRTLTAAMVAVAPADRRRTIRHAALGHGVIANVQIGGPLVFTGGNPDVLICNVRIGTGRTAHGRLRQSGPV